MKLWQVWRVAIADLQPSGSSGPRTSLRAMLAHPPVTVLIVTAGVAAANLTWLDPVSPHIMHHQAVTPLQHAVVISATAVLPLRRCEFPLTQVLGPRCEAIGFSVPGIGLLFGFQSAVYAVSSPLAG
jgi:hypothetical protein